MRRELHCVTLSRPTRRFTDLEIFQSAGGSVDFVHTEPLVVANCVVSMCDLKSRKYRGTVHVSCSTLTSDVHCIGACQFWDDEAEFAHAH